MATSAVNIKRNYCTLAVDDAMLITEYAMADTGRIISKGVTAEDTGLADLHFCTMLHAGHRPHLG